MAVPTGRESDKFMLRLPDGMRERIRAAAEANQRSMNQEIVARLEGSLDAEPRSMENFQTAVERMEQATLLLTEFVHRFEEVSSDVGRPERDPVTSNPSRLRTSE